MNNEKLILEALRWLLVNTKPIQKMQEDENLRIYEEISKALNPKEDVPYEKSFAKKDVSEKGEGK